MPNTFLGLMLLEVSRTVISTCSAGIVLLVIGAMGARNDVAQARGLDKVVTLGNLCFAMPLAVFSMEHFFDAKSIVQLVPAYMPWRLFWTYFVGFGLLGASLSIATKVLVRLSGLLFGIMMFSFVAMMDLPAALATPHDRIAWVLLCRELSFGAGGWCLAAAAMERSRGANWLAIIGRFVIGIAAIFYGVEYFLHPLQVPGVPLEKLMPTWIPGRIIIDYLNGIILVFLGACILLGKRTQMAATYLGSWMVLMVLGIYGPILAASLADQNTTVKVEGINYFFDTLLYAGTVLAVARYSLTGDLGAKAKPREQTATRGVSSSSYQHSTGRP